MAASGVAIDERSGLVLPQARLYSRAARTWEFVGTITYLCHSCGHLIPRPWEVFYVDDTPGQEWASNFTPPKTTRRTTTHHDWHMAQDGD